MWVVLAVCSFDAEHVEPDVQLPSRVPVVWSKISISSPDPLMTWLAVAVRVTGVPVAACDADELSVTDPAQLATQVTVTTLLVA